MSSEIWNNNYLSYFFHTVKAKFVLLHDNIAKPILIARLISCEGFQISLVIVSRRKRQRKNWYFLRLEVIM